jgi:hypothetical protein
MQYEDPWGGFDGWGLSMVDAATHKEVDFLWVEVEEHIVFRGFSIKLDPAADRVYVIDRRNPHLLWIIDIDDEGHQTTTMDLGAEIRELAVNPFTGRAYAALDDPDHTLAVIDGASKTVVGRVEMPAPSGAMALDRRLGRVFVGAGSEMVVIQDLPPGIITVHGLYDLILGLTGGDHGLVEHLQAAMQVLEDTDSSNDADAVRSLLAFVQDVENRRGFAIGQKEADKLVGSAWEIVASLYGLD